LSQLAWASPSSFIIYYFYLFFSVDAPSQENMVFLDRLRQRMEAMQEENNRLRQGAGSSLVSARPVSGGAANGGGAMDEVKAALISRNNELEKKNNELMESESVMLYANSRLFGTFDFVR
jgi:hypothetical protein